MEELTVDQKMAKVMVKLRMIRPFYFGIYSAMQKEATNSIDTMGVTADTLCYNPEFVESTSFSEFLFINLHEVAHVALMHVARKEARDPLLWNIACDLYVNKSLTEEFNLRLGIEHEIGGSVLIKAPESMCYCDTIDIDKDYAEKIYESFEKQANDNGYFSGDQSEDQEYSFSYTGSGKSRTDSGFGVLQRSTNTDTFEIKIKKSDKAYDLIDDGSEQSEKEQKARKIVTDAKVRTEMTFPDIGSTPSKIERLSGDLLKSYVDWRKLLRRYLTEALSSDSSFSMPDKRMYYQDAIYPGRSKEESNYIDGVKVCIDTSGSISSTDLGTFFNQVNNLLKQYKINTELIYWDAEIESMGEFSTYQEFKRVGVFGGGGTNPGCVFDNFEKSKKQPTVILMFTDGYFYTNWVKKTYKKKYKNTIWIITKDGNKEFKAPFGKMAAVRYEG